MTVSADQLATQLMTSARPPQPRCRACKVPLDAVLVDREDNSGLHMGCDEPATQIAPVPVPAPQAPPTPVPGPTTQTPSAGPPPSTIAELRNLLITHEAGSARSAQKMIGPSEIGQPCQRALGYKLLNAPEREDPRVPWAPILGTSVHAYIADMLTAENTKLGRERWVVEQRVWPDDVISGSGDAYDVDSGTVIDWKLVGDNSLRKYRKAMKPEYRIQAHLYGLGHQRAGRDVRWVRIVCLHRSHNYDLAWEWTEAYNPDIATAALARLYDTAQLLSDIGVEQTPALWGAIPGTYGNDCRWCRYFRPSKPADETGCPGDPNSWP